METEYTSKKDKISTLNRDTYLSDSIPIMYKDILNIIDEYVDDDTKYMLGDTKIIQKNNYLLGKVILKGIISCCSMDSIAPYYRWPDGKINNIKVLYLHDRILDCMDIKDYLCVKTLNAWKFFLTNDYFSEKNMTIVLPYEIITKFKLNGKSESKLV
jgi:hypothetical protein